ncbi:MAG: SUMF1/EgtB/PvdO family nonheme iron enzyme, partial [Candidatus Poribacteria bacterium]|nr:SUMF1/EgtB/PvdO family nonheme iron enzyme [Candidatus Poribacteria bacterium]
DTTPNRIKWEKDSAEMVLIPAGSFEMGDHFNEGDDIEQPVHTVTLDEFYMDSTEVTNAQYRVFMEQTGHREPRYWTDSSYNQDNQPMVFVSWMMRRPMLRT